MMQSPNTSGLEIAREAQSWIGTPYVHQARVRGVGVDCVGLVTCVAADLGYPHYADLRYWHMPEGDQILIELDRLFDPVQPQLSEPGDVLAFAWRRQAQHIGIRTQHGFVHADNSAAVKMVVEVSLDYKWRGRLAGAWRWRR